VENNLFIGIPDTKVIDTMIHTSQIMPRSSLGVGDSHVRL